MLELVDLLKSSLQGRDKSFVTVKEQMLNLAVEYSQPDL